jgi:hypothetical protein
MHYGNKIIIHDVHGAPTTINVACPITRVVTVVEPGPQGRPGDNASLPEGTVSGSEQILEFGIFATTGSNTFEGEQIITGSVIITDGSNVNVIVNESGNIGINTSTPTTTLDVNGNTFITGSLSVTEGISGSFSGSGAQLYDIPASAIVGLNLNQISSGSVSASISPDDGLQINTNVTAESFTGSLLGTATFSITSSNTILQNNLLTNQTVGGLSSGTSLPSGSSVESVLRRILITYIPPTLSGLVMRNGASNIPTSARDVGNSFTVNTASFSATADNPDGIFPVSSSWTGSGADIGTQTFYFGDNVLSSSNARSIGDNYTINRASASGTVTFTVNGRRSDNNAAITGTSTSIAFLWRNYLAASSTLVSDNTTAQTVVNATVASVLASNKTWTATCTAANDTLGNFTYIIYPASYGDLSNIIQNGATPVLGAFTKIGDFTISNAFGSSILVRIYKSNADKAFANGTTLAIS